MKRIVFFVWLCFIAVVCRAQINSLIDDINGYSFSDLLPHSTKVMRAWYANFTIKPTDLQPFETASNWLYNLPGTLPMNLYLAEISAANILGTAARPESKRFNYQVLTFYKREPFRFESFEWEEISKNVMRLYRPSIKITRHSIRVKPF
ncbi:MAG: hypothetical protein V4615_07965 [Bacteroidota bacterium]